MRKGGVRKGGGSEEGVRKEGVSGEGGREWWAVRESCWALIAICGWWWWWALIALHGGWHSAWLHHHLS